MAWEELLKTRESREEDSPAAAREELPEEMLQILSIVPEPRFLPEKHRTGSLIQEQSLIRMLC